MSIFHHKLFSTNISTTFLFQCNEHVEMNKFLCSLACTWMKILDSQFYIIDLSSDVSLEWNANLVYEDCSNMNARSFITSFTYILRQNFILFWKELFVAFKMAPITKKHSLNLSSYRPLYKGRSCILKFFWSKLKCTFWYMCGHTCSAISL